MKIIASLCALLCLAGCIELALVSCESLTPTGRALAGCDAEIPNQKGGPHSTPGN